MPSLSIYPTTRMDKVSSSSCKCLRAIRLTHKPQTISTFFQHTNLDFAPTTNFTSKEDIISVQSKCKTMQPGSLLLLQSPAGSHLIQISTIAPTTGHLLRPYDWESLIQFGSYPNDAWDREYLSESTFDALITEESDASLEPSREHLASIDVTERIFYGKGERVPETKRLKYRSYEKAQRLDLQKSW
ncbi:hypothetical protein AC578_799 [Pseudocercospora eumusae]|uniref:Uncharacterized protein n=1 Tax=Pseudocercospora eumusae TaxID=321146 RepID=A0A139HC02_9PEZI|nr:hypothetical protein AC578_799 [Pseudocercospora eumusae]